ncbi:MAG: hypothetical protein ACRDIV_05690 [Ktedonobacteraceae bacterium]
MQIVNLVVILLSPTITAVAAHQLVHNVRRMLAVIGACHLVQQIVDDKLFGLLNIGTNRL